MALTRTVTWKVLQTKNDAPLTGQVHFLLGPAMVSGGGVTYVRDEHTVTLDSAGVATATLPRTDDPALGPESDWVYEVVPELHDSAGNRVRAAFPFTITVPAGTGALDISPQVPQVNAGGKPTVFVEGKQGPKGDTGATGPQGPQGLPGTNAVPSDTAVAGYINTAGTSETKTALLATIDDSIGLGGSARPTLDGAIDLKQEVAFAGHVAVSEASSARVTDLRARMQLTPDGRTRATLATGQDDQTYILSNCTRVADTARFLEGTRSQRFTTTGAVTATAILDPVYPSPAADPFTFAPASIVRALVWIDDPSKITTFNVEIYNNSGLTSPWVRGIANHAVPFVKGWNLLSWKASAGSTTDWGAAYRVRVVTVTTAATSWNVQSVWVECPPKAQILFIEDRGYKTFIDSGLPDLRARGIPVTWALDPALNGSNVGTKAEAITDAQVAQFYGEGDDMSIHAYDGAVTSTMTADQLRADVLKSHQWLQDRGYTRGRRWRAAWTQNNAPEHAVARPYYAAYATPNGTASSETWPFTEPRNVSRVNLHGLTTASMDGFFATLQKTYGLLVCYTHGIHVDGGSDMTPTLWAHFLTKLDAGISGGWLEGVTFSQLLERSGGVMR